MNDSETSIQAKGLTAPSITPADIEATIAFETYFTGGDGFAGALSVSPEFANLPTNEDGDPIIQAPEQLELMTTCVLVLRNGHTVAGTAYCADPAKFNADTGRIEARKRAIDALWPMVIYAERERLAREPAKPGDFRDRVRAEAAELDDRITKLQAFLPTDTFQALPVEERGRLNAQFAAMLDYSNCLAERIKAFGA